MLLPIFSPTRSPSHDRTHLLPRRCSFPNTAPSPTPVPGSRMQASLPDAGAPWLDVGHTLPYANTIVTGLLWLELPYVNTTVTCDPKNGSSDAPWTSARGTCSTRRDLRFPHLPSNL